MPLLPLPSHAGWSISHTLRRLRQALLWAFLPLATCLAFPSLLIALFLWWSAGRTWDTRERWSGIWLLAGVCGAVYGGLLWLDHPLPFLLQAVALDLLRQRAEVLEALRHHGVQVIDVAPGDLSPAVLNGYLEVTFRGLL